jgi:hypothetical protein
MPAYNGRFGASGAVARPKVSTNLEVLRPPERQWKPRLRQAAGTLCVMQDGHSNEHNFVENFLRQILSVQKKEPFRHDEYSCRG